MSDEWQIEIKPLKIGGQDYVAISSPGADPKLMRVTEFASQLGAAMRTSDEALTEVRYVETDFTPLELLRLAARMLIELMPDWQYE